jgi:hypothetical protein
VSLKPPVESNTPRRRDWLAVLAIMLALAGGGAYFWKYSQQVPAPELLQFTALWVACPLAISVVLLFAWLKYPR